MATFEELMKKDYGEDFENKFVKVKNRVLSAYKSEKTLIARADSIVDTVLGLKLDIDSLSAAYAYPFVLQNSEIIEEFAEFTEVYKILKSLLSVEEFSNKYTDPAGLKEMLLAITKDIRVVIIKSAQMLVLARENVKKTTDKKAQELFMAIDDIYAPFAARLGLSEIKSELQDLSFEFHRPEEYMKLKFDVAHESRANTHMINKMVASIKSLLVKNNIECTCYGRIKHISSIYNKLQNKAQTLKNIYDIAATRILVNSVSECYAVLGIVHANFTPVDGRFKDYIANPKPNGYKSLHTTVYYHDEFFEVQIRTYDMHEYAEYGVAAHFLYKEKKNKLNSVDNKLLWIRKMLENKDNMTSSDILEELKTDVYLGEIFVQTPKGKVIKLVENATPIDFAYAIHSEVGNRCVGARVNGGMVPLTSSLSNGDVVEILTSQNSKGPSRDWLKKVKMSSTKDSINYFFKKQMKGENIKLGKTMIENAAKAFDIPVSRLMAEEYVAPLLKKQAFVSVDELYAAVGYGSMTAEKVVRRLLGIKEREEQKKRTLFDEIEKNKIKIDNKSEIIGAAGALTKYCKCCNPIPGDDIVGYVSRGRGIIIHKKDCENVPKLTESRFIPVDWNIDKLQDETFTAGVDVVAKNKNSVYIEIANALSELNVKVMSLNTSQNKNEELLLKIGLLVKDRNQLQQVKNKLSSLTSVYEVL
ncbi:MAG: bifunctional (p)ppGpp synthetase/guanosine-3',5'-bis(diphosphate) 3'-pyrophosphohydrolase [Clostridiales bacterium]|nr:bifunctional (p)ppGpp synthetase/guanosine-3',5'-bis(diphosphate) 3'-pyrophosphohydrolase [Clostridiales bacterium]